MRKMLQAWSHNKFLEVNVSIFDIRRMVEAIFSIVMIPHVHCAVPKCKPKIISSSWIVTVVRIEIEVIRFSSYKSSENVYTRTTSATESEGLKIDRDRNGKPFAEAFADWLAG